MSLQKATKIDVIVDFFEGYNFKDQEIILSPGEKITNVKKFVEANIRLLLANRGKKVYKPYYDRLNKLYNILSKQI